MKYSLSLRTYNFLSHKLLLCYSRITTLWTYFIGHIQNVCIGKKCNFIGVMTFNVFRGGEIIIGNRCVFVSKETSNLLGLNHRCIFSATPAIPSSSCSLIIGNNCGFSGTTIWCFSRIELGNNVRCGANTLIMDGDAHFEDSRTSPPRPIIIKDNVFLGANVVVKKGVTIGENSVIGMNSVVTHDIPANSVAVGVPCKVIHQVELYSK
ncbi:MULTISPECIES: acyltransferase [Bacteroides]|uniref:acyltransferase n=1 Tax=Bacteroides TaxID=816 RepID=UPI000B37D7AD|nr:MULTISPECIES: acyltransferase [Bacteroides]OUO62682.1 transferase [Bacteroides sp. An279]